MPRIGGQIIGGAHSSTHEDGGADEISIASLSGESAVMTTHKADLDAHTKNLLELLRTGEYILPFPPRADVELTLVADAIYAHPFHVARAITIDRLAIEVITGDAGKIARLGIYRDGTNLYPGALVKDFGTVSVASTAIVAASADQSLTKGLYWLVMVSNGTPGVSRFYAAWTGLGMLATDFSVTDVLVRYYKVGVGSAALADPFVSGAALTGSGVPVVFPRLSSLD